MADIARTLGADEPTSYSGLTTADFLVLVSSSNILGASLVLLTLTLTLLSPSSSSPSSHSSKSRTTSNPLQLPVPRQPRSYIKTTITTASLLSLFSLIVFCVIQLCIVGINSQVWCLFQGGFGFGSGLGGGGGGGGGSDSGGRGDAGMGEGEQTGGIESLDEITSYLCPTPAQWANGIPGENLVFARPFVEVLLAAMNDLIIISRAVALYPGSRRIFYVSLLLPWVLCMASGITYLLISRSPYPSTPSPGIDFFVFNGAVVFTTLSILTNAVGTGTIGVKVWIYRRTVKLALGTSTPSYKKIQKLLFTLAESGFGYCVIQITFLLCTVLTDPIHDAFLYVFQHFIYVISGLYPVVVYILLGIQKKMRMEESVGIVDLNELADFEIEDEEEKIEIELVEMNGDGGGK